MSGDGTSFVDATIGPTSGSDLRARSVYVAQALAAVSIGALAAAAVLALALSGCAEKPTRAIETESRFSQEGAEAPDDTPAAPFVSTEPSPDELIALTNETVVIDVRRPFDFASSRIPRSLSMQWSDFTQTLQSGRGVLQKDLFQVARRLARAGIETETPVVVVGDGRQGGGEEGRVAWMLRYLGVKHVRFASIRSFPGPFTSKNPFPNPNDLAAPPAEPSPRNAPMWKPQTDESWIAAREEVRQALGQTGQKVDKRSDAVLLDVRPTHDFQGQEGFGLGRSVPTSGVINFPWTDVLDEKGRLSCAFARKLARLKVSARRRVIALDEFGVASGAVTVALRTCGYPNSANYAGGWRDLLSTAPEAQ